MKIEAPGSLRTQLLSGLGALQLEGAGARADVLLAYVAELEKWNAAYNLTAIRDPAEMVTRHLLDSLALLPLIASGRAPHAAHLLDVGSGAGLPGIVLAVARPDLQVTTLDSNGKKARFMRHAVRTLKLPNVQVVEGRAEDHAGAYEIIASRAFASLADFFDKTAHLLAAGGVWMAMKGKLDAAELAAIPASAQIRETQRLRVPGLSEDRHVVIAEAKP